MIPAMHPVILAPTRDKTLKVTTVSNLLYKGRRIIFLKVYFQKQNDLTVIASARNSRKYRRFRQHHNTSLPKSQQKCSPIHQCCCNLVLDRNLSNEPLSQSVKTNVPTIIFTFSVLDRLINVVSNCSNFKFTMRTLENAQRMMLKMERPRSPLGLKRGYEDTAIVRPAVSCYNL
jgi:hypothetical protein